MSHRIFQISAAAAALAAMPALASAQSVAFSTSPVSVTSCSVVQSYDPLAFAGPYTLGTIGLHATNDVVLTYVNKGSVPATTVKVALSDGNYSQSITAQGSFAPGASIEKTVAAGIDANAVSNAACSVAEVDFADGSTWHAGSRDVAKR